MAKMRVLARVLRRSVPDFDPWAQTDFKRVWDFTGRIIMFLEIKPKTRCFHSLITKTVNIIFYKIQKKP